MPAPPLLFWHPSDMSLPPLPHLPPSHSHLLMTRCVTFRFADDFRNGEWANPVEQFNQIQTDLDHLRNWASRWQMYFKVQKCRLIVRGESKAVYGWGKRFGRQAHWNHYLSVLGQAAQLWVTEADQIEYSGDFLLDGMQERGPVFLK